MIGTSILSKRNFPPLAFPLLLSLAVYAAAEVYSAAHVDATAAAEGRFLALWAGAVLLAAGLAGSDRQGFGRAWMPAALLVVVALWTAPPGPARGAVVGLLLVAATAAAAVHAASRLETPNELPLEKTLPLALAVQLLLRGDRLVALAGPEPAGFAELRPLLPVLAGAAAAALAATWLAPRVGRSPALLAVATAAVLGGGWSARLGAGLVALAVARWLCRPGVFVPFFAGCGLTGGLAVMLAWRFERVEMALCLVVGFLLGAFLGLKDEDREPAAGSLDARGRAWWLKALVTAALALAVFGLLGQALFALEAASLGPAVGSLAWLLLVLPVLPVMLWYEGPGASRMAAALLVVALLLGLLLALRPGSSLVALALPAAALALALPAAGSAAQIQRAWTVALLVLAALTASYPWLRPEPAVAALELLGLAPGWGAALLLTLGWLVASWCFASLSWLRSPWRRLPVGHPAAAVALFLLLALAARALPPVTPRLASPVQLNAHLSRWHVQLPAGESVAAVTVDSHLDHGAELPAGTPVATVRLRAGGRVLEHTLEAGRDSGEWAARRPDVAALAGLATPPPWQAWVAPEGGFFAQRYRGHWRPVPAPDFAGGELEVERRADLPADVTLRLFAVSTDPGEALESPPGGRP